MIPSEKLRKIISKMRKVNLEDFKWDESLKKSVFKLKYLNVNKEIGLREVFKNGYNIGNCTITAYCVSKLFDRSSICTGKVEILKGTKNSENGEHVWVETYDFIIDTTLMIKVPLDSIIAQYYHKEDTITPLFSPFDYNYSIDEHLRKVYPENYYAELFDVKK